MNRRALNFVVPPRNKTDVLDERERWRGAAYSSAMKMGEMVWLSTILHERWFPMKIGKLLEPGSVS